MGAAETTAVYVAYRTETLHLGWIPDDAPIVVVHNDTTLSPESLDRPGLTQLFSATNIGFGAACNRALEAVTTERVALVNPDMRLTSDHWTALTSGAPDEMVSVPVVDSDGHPTAVVSSYPSPVVLVLTGWRIGRWLRRWVPRDNPMRSRVLPLGAVGAWDLRDHWVSGAVLATDVERLRTVGGFDEGYFLYLEDVDLCRRLADRFPGMRAIVSDIAPAVHAVSSSSAGSGRRSADLHYVRSARRYAAGQRGIGWRIAAAALAPRERWLTGTAQ